MMMEMLYDDDVIMKYDEVIVKMIVVMATS